MTESAARSHVGAARPPSRPWLLAPDVVARLDATMLAVLDELTDGLLPAARRSVQSPGKRLRPALVLAAAAASGHGAAFGAATAMQAAAAVELLHHATLVHDDLLDGSTRRHGADTVNVRDGATSALLTGDVLIAAAGVCAARCHPAAALTVSRTLAALCRGEALQAGQRFDADVTVEQVLTVARLKAGSLLGAAAVLGGEVAGADATTLDALARFGLEFGTALQLVDDLLDVLGDAETLGKPVGVDFAAGTVTLPAIVALQRHPELRSLLRPDPDETSRHRALRLLRCPHALRATRSAALASAERAAAALRSAVDTSPGSRELADLADWPGRFVADQLQAVTAEPAAAACDGHCDEPARDR